MYIFIYHSVKDVQPSMLSYEPPKMTKLDKQSNKNNKTTNICVNPRLFVQARQNKKCF
jgi:hypothetical protein